MRPLPANIALTTISHALRLFHATSVALTIVEIGTGGKVVYGGEGSGVVHLPTCRNKVKDGTESDVRGGRANRPLDVGRFVQLSTTLFRFEFDTPTLHGAGRGAAMQTESGRPPLGRKHTAGAARPPYSLDVNIWRDWCGGRSITTIPSIPT